MLHKPKALKDRVEVPLIRLFTTKKGMWSARLACTRSLVSNIQLVERTLSLFYEFLKLQASNSIPTPF